MAKVRLTWLTADGKISILYEDNGNLLTRSFRYPIREDMLNKCRLGGYITAYRAQPSRATDWQAGTKAFGKVLANCSVIEPKQIDSYVDEFEAAAPYFERATVALRSVASTMFKSLRRCTRLKYSPRYGGPDATVTCTRHEG
jgi:hypothetical protein